MQSPPSAQATLIEAQTRLDNAEAWLAQHEVLITQIEQQIATLRTTGGSSSPGGQSGETEVVPGSNGLDFQPKGLSALQAQLDDLNKNRDLALQNIEFWQPKVWEAREKIQPLTTQEQQAKQADLENTQARTAEIRAGIAAKAAEAAAAADPTNQALAQALTRAQTAAQQASARANEASARASDQSAAIDAIFLPFKIAETQAGTNSTNVNTARTEALIPGELRQQLLNAGMTELQIQELEQSIVRTGNLMPYEIAQAQANIRQTLASAGVSEAEAKNWAEKLAGGLSGIELDQARADARKATADATKAEQGDPQYALNQLREAIGKGNMTPRIANTLADEIISGKTLSDRIQQASQNAQALTTTAATNNMFVRPGQTSFDQSGSLMKALAKVGIDVSPEDLALDTKSMPQWAQQMGINLDPNAGLSPMFDAQGKIQGGPAWAQQMAQGQVAPPPTPADVAVPVPGKTEPEAPAPVDPWQAGVNASPVLSAAQQFGEAINAEPVANGVTKVTYRDGSTRMFNADGSEGQQPAEPAPAPPQPAPAAGGAQPSITINVSGNTSGSGSGGTPAPQGPPHPGRANVSQSGLPAGGPPRPPAQPSVSGSGLPAGGPPHQGSANNPNASSQMDTRRMRHGGRAIVPPAWARRLALGVR